MDFTQWRATARRLLAQDVPPHEAHWDEPGQNALFVPAVPGDAPARAAIRVPARLLPVLQDAACHRSPRRLGLMYRALWRITHGERALPEDPADDDMRALYVMQREVRRDRHKMTAFVRFRELRDAAGGEARWIAWFEPSHRILASVAPFFVERFGTMHWTIATPDGIATWDRHALALLVTRRQIQRRGQLHAARQDITVLAELTHRVEVHRAHAIQELTELRHACAVLRFDR